MGGGIEMGYGLPTKKLTQPTNRLSNHPCLESTYELATESKLAGDEYLNREVKQLLEDQW